MQNALKLKIIVGSTRQGRFGRKVGDWVADEAAKHGAFETQILDLAEINLPFLNDAVLPMMRHGVYEDEAVQRWADQVADGEAFIIVTPEYNHGYPGVLKNAIDSIYHEWADKPIGFVGYSSTPGAARGAVAQLLPIVYRLKLTPVAPSVNIPNLRPEGPDDSIDLAASVQAMQATLDNVAKFSRLLKSTRTHAKVSV